MAPVTCPTDRPSRPPRSDSDGNARRTHRDRFRGRRGSTGRLHFVQISTRGLTPCVFLLLLAARGLRREPGGEAGAEGAQSPPHTGVDAVRAGRLGCRDPGEAGTEAEGDHAAGADDPLLELARCEADLELLARPIPDRGREALRDLADPVAHALHLEVHLLRVDAVEDAAADAREEEPARLLE